jgi:hypothetical protein
MGNTSGFSAALVADGTTITSYDDNATTTATRPSLESVKIDALIVVDDL